MNLVFASGFLVPQRILGVVDYFNGLEVHIGDKHKTLFAKVPPTGRCKDRALTLAKAIRDKFPNGDIHIIAHSMGGLDSRVLIAANHFSLSQRIKSLTTIATPHLGTEVADLLIGRRQQDEREFLASIADVLVPGVGGLLGRFVDALPIPGLPDGAFFGDIAGVIRFLGIDQGALADLTTDGAQALPDPLKPPLPFPIRYRSYAAVGRPPADFRGIPKQTCLLFVPFHMYIKKVTGQDNDGLVPLRSTERFGEFLGKWECDHADAVGYNLDNPLHPVFPHLAHYDAIISDLEKLFPA